MRRSGRGAEGIGGSVKPLSQLSEAAGGGRAPNRRGYFVATATRFSRVRKKRVPSEMAAVARQVSPSLLVARTENLAPTGMTKTLPSSLVK